MPERTNPSTPQEHAIDAHKKNGTQNLFPLTVNDLSLAIDGTDLLDRVSFTLTAERRTLILGPNGAGKSLLLRTLHGLMTPTGGTMFWNGRPLDARIRMQQALVFQRPVLLRRTAEANIRFVLGDLSQEEQNQRVETLLRQSSLLDQAKTPARLLSGGEQQRLAIARAMALKPRILFLDEPCASLDPAATKDVEELISTVHNSGTKIIAVTHDLGQARRLADDILFLHGGKLAEHTLAPDFFNSPVSSAASHFLQGRIVV